LVTENTPDAVGLDVCHVFVHFVANDSFEGDVPVFDDDANGREVALIVDLQGCVPVL
jgi:hypothetical protein